MKHYTMSENTIRILEKNLLKRYWIYSFRYFKSLMGFNLLNLKELRPSGKNGTNVVVCMQYLADLFPFENHLETSARLEDFA